MIHCDNCDNEFGVSCDVLLEDGTLLHNYSEAFILNYLGGAQS